MKKPLIFSALILALSMTATAQGVRGSAKTSDQPTAQTTVATNAAAQTTKQTVNLPKPKPAPNTFAAEYQGGLFGYAKKVKGTLTYDDANKRFVFRDKENKEIFGFPYKSLLVVSGDSRSYRPTAATVAGAIPSIYALPAAFIRAKKRFLIVQFNDPDSNVQGTSSFKVANKELLESVIQTLGDKAELKQRGDAFYRPREETKPVL